MMLADEVKEVLTEVLPEFGAPVTLTRKVKGEYNLATAKQANDGTLEQSPLCITENKGRWLDGVVIGEKYLFMGADGLTFVPAPADRFEHGGVKYTVMEKGVVPIEVNGVAVAYEVYGVSG